MVWTVDKSVEAGIHELPRREPPLRQSSGGGWFLLAVTLSVLIVGLVSGIAIGYWAIPKGACRFQYSVENLMHGENAEVFWSTTHLDTNSEPLLSRMDEAAEKNKNFDFKTVHFEGLGEYVTTINGIEENTEASLSWVLIRRSSGSDCIIPAGVHIYVPQVGEHVIFTYAYSGPGGIYSKVQPCGQSISVV